MALDFFEVHDVCVLMVQVEKVDFVGKETAIKATLFHDHCMEPIRVSINDTGTNATARAFSTNNEAVNAMLDEVGDQRRSKKSAGPLFVND